jgi:transcriptional regulator with XRE-family HTH domain
MFMESKKKDKVLRIFHKILSEKVAAAELSGMKQYQYAESIGLKAPFLSDILLGKKTGERSIFEICEKAGIPLSDLEGTVPEILVKAQEGAQIQPVAQINDKQPQREYEQLLRNIELLESENRVLKDFVENLKEQVATFKEGHNTVPSKKNAQM